MVYVENLKESMDTLLELTSEFSMTNKFSRSIYNLKNKFKNIIYNGFKKCQIYRNLSNKLFANLVCGKL